MDLPISRIARTALVAESDGDIRLHDNAFGSDLMTLTDSVELGQYVVGISYMAECGSRIYKLMKIDSEYDFETLSRRPLMRDLGTRVRTEGYTIHQLGLYHEREGVSYVGNIPIEVSYDPISQELLYVECLETT